ncbi:glycosyl transferase [bacterium]|nr:glycosyl transferase [bacterium]
MNPFSLFARAPAFPWDGAAPVREELFGVERLELHAESLAAAQRVTNFPPKVWSLQRRLNENAAVLLAAYRASASELESGRAIVPAAEWLLDNYHVVEEQIREIRDDLPPGFYRQLPKLAGGPFAGYPRVFGMAWAFVAHTDSHFDPDSLRGFIAAYQRVQPLTIGELWAVAITLRIVLIENLRRLADQISAARSSRAEADALADHVLVSGFSPDTAIAKLARAPLPELFAAQYAKRLRDHDPSMTPTFGWLEERLSGQHVSIDDVVLHAQQRQGASNVTVRNIITSMRRISDLDWPDLFEAVSLVDASLRASSGFAAMDFPTRDNYRGAIEELARGSALSERDIAEEALRFAQCAAAEASDPAEAGRVGDPGYFLIAEGRPALERAVGFRAPVRLLLRRFNIRLGIAGYVGAIVVIALALIGLAIWMLEIPTLLLAVLLFLAAFVPATDVATALVNRAITRLFGAATLPGLELASGAPSSLRTLVVVPTLLTSEADLLDQVGQLEVHYLSGAAGDIAFALLLDGVDADSETIAGEERLLGAAASAVEDLNRRHGPGPAGNRFIVLHRKRVFNAGEGKWMGWERKRGKLHELNRLLRGATDTTFVPIEGQAPDVPADVRYVITLDADTRLPRDAAVRLIGKMAHPLNRPRMDAGKQRVVGGYGILQPRVTPSLPVGREGSLYQRVFSSPGGMDPYAAAVSDVYQDLFGEGSYTGKGIYDVDAFEASLAGRIPENTLLSHDLFEGIYARAGLASDIEVVEEFPSRYDVAAKRQHRWTRGDWQLLPWIFRKRTDKHAITAVGMGKILDNLRRSLLAPALFATLGLTWLLPMPSALLGGLIVLGAVAIPAFLPIAFSIVPHRSSIRMDSHAGRLGADIRLAATQTALTLLFLPDQAWRMCDAIARTKFRLFWSHRHMLQWTTAAQSAGAARLRVRGFYRQMAGGVGAGSLMAAGAGFLAPDSLPVILPIALCWLAAPAIALWSSRAPASSGLLALAPAESGELRRIARRTWRFFETFVTPEDNMLPPDNFQEDPDPVVAHRTSPTNIGLYLLSTAAARDFSWTGMAETIERLEACFDTLDKLERLNGHFFNWYDTRDLRTLDPAYVSSVDSGNLAGHLIALANTCEEWIDAPFAENARAGMLDNLHLANEALDTQNGGPGDRKSPLPVLLDEIETLLTGAQALTATAAALGRLADKAAGAARDIAPASERSATPEPVFWTEALSRRIREFERDRMLAENAPDGIRRRLHALADRARGMAMAMDFAFLLDPERKLLSIGYSMLENSIDTNCYDLLASEARLASLFAIAKGDVPTRHWFRLGRAATPLGGGAALISWSGSMFEYLMPSLVMRAPAGSLLSETNRRVVKRQQEYARTLDMPWGVSESAYNARDIEFTYQYSNFGVPGLGLKRGLSENRVIAPYATGLATMIDPHGALRNYARIADMGGSGPYGFYEALDFTPSRLPEGQEVAIVRNVMAHHQGMTIVAIANTLQDGRMRARFHRDPMIKASELLLQERTPRDVAIAHPRAEEVKISASEARRGVQTTRCVEPHPDQPPVTHLLSNGRYAVMLTATGAGYSRWGETAVTRWREDVTKDDWGSFVFLKDVRSGAVWSPGAYSADTATLRQKVFFAEDRAEFIRQDGTLTTVMDVLVSGEDDGEVRRVSVTNTGRKRREIELTSYCELVLTTPATDNAHPAFAKMFVQTEYLPEFGALVATRRKRAPDENEIWAAHFAIVEGDISADPQYESDRAKFLGRGNAIARASAIVGNEPLSNTVGTVLDPIFSLRHRVVIAPGKLARIAFWTLVASSREELMVLLDTHHSRSAYDRIKTLAWTQAQVQLRHLDVEPEEAADFQRLAAPILYADPQFRGSPETILRGAGRQSALWPLSISGDLPIVLLRISEMEDVPQVRQLLRAHEYWRMKQLGVDLVIVNERTSSYVQDLQNAIESAVRASQARPPLQTELAQGAVHVLRTDLISGESRALLNSVARVLLRAHRGLIADQLARLPSANSALAPIRGQKPRMLAPASPAPAGLEFFNGIGGFDKNGAEYVTVLQAGVHTPAPWINVIANPQFGFQVSATGSGYSWAQNSRENQITPWSNDPVCDPSGEAIYIRDEASGALWSPTAQPIRDEGTYVARHGFGYSRFEHTANGVAASLLQYVSLKDPVKISRLTLTNRTGQVRRLSVTTYAEWVLGTFRGANAPFIATERDADTGALFARIPWNTAFPDRVSFADLGGRQTAWTADRTEFIGRHGSLERPSALLGDKSLSGVTGAGLDPCSALQCTIELAAGATVEIAAFLGQCATSDEARALIARYRAADLDAMLAEVTGHWTALTGSVQVVTPDRAMDIMLNGWLLYQTLACRIWARSGFYQASGAYGFRDQLQDGMALTFARPDATRQHILRAAARQFVEGDVQHWWLPHSGQGVRTRISDDRVWLAFATATYVGTAGDAAILDEKMPFLEGPALAEGAHDAFFEPMVGEETACLFEHCARGLDQCLELTGANGLPLIGTGDWNDGMSRVGEAGKGESVWLGWLLVRTIALFAPFAQTRDPVRAERWRTHAASVAAALEAAAWDGEWYRRATYDDGSWLGSAGSGECEIDSIAQSWAVLSGAADPARAATAMASLDRRLIDGENALALLFTPPFDKTPRDPGYIKGYPPGLRENGGQYSHAAMWAILAFARLGQSEKAHALFSLINPINHALSPDAAGIYKVEPYVVAADVYSVAPHAGRGGWTWYTGSAGWMHRAGVEGILGIRREGGVLVVDPCIPPHWPGFNARIEVKGTSWDVSVTASREDRRTQFHAVIDGVPDAAHAGPVRLPLDGGAHRLELDLPTGLRDS